VVVGSLCSAGMYEGRSQKEQEMFVYTSRYKFTSTSTVHIKPYDLYVQYYSITTLHDLLYKHHASYNKHLVILSFL